MTQGLLEGSAAVRVPGVEEPEGMLDARTVCVFELTPASHGNASAFGKNSATQDNDNGAGNDLIYGDNPFGTSAAGPAPPPGTTTPAAPMRMPRSPR